MADEQTLTHSEELFLKAKAGEKLTTDDRRDLIAYIMVVNPDISNIDMARMFNLSEGAIRKDKEVIRKRAAEEISGEDVGLVISDIRRVSDRFCRDMEKGIKACEPGTKVYLEYQKALVDYQIKIVESLQSLGFYPKNLGILQKNSFVFKSIVSKDGSVNTSVFDPKNAKIIDGHVAIQRQLPAPSFAPVELTEEEKSRNSLRDEFSDTPSNHTSAATPDGDYEDDGT